MEEKNKFYKETLNANGIEISVISNDNENDYISLTDIAKYENPDDASWIYMRSLESLTKEILSYDTRIKLCERIKELDSYISNDNKFKIFLLKGGKIDSVWERG